MEDDPTKRFSDRVDKYVQYRPRYPKSVRECLIKECGLTATAVIADIGSGTGFLSELFLEHGNPVFGVEPNEEMRQAAGVGLRSYPHFTSIDGTAEDTTLVENGVEFVTAGQAFHWFDVPRAKIEFRRILKPGGFVALIWNERKFEEAPFMIAYEELLEEFGISYQKVKQTGSYEEIETFLGSEVQMRTFENGQSFDLQGLQGRFLSSSYAPMPGHPLHEPVLQAVRRLFDSFQRNGRIKFEYNTRIYFGQLG
jgi:SAM-dependent methyltransferase